MNDITKLDKTLAAPTTIDAPGFQWCSVLDPPFALRELYQPLLSLCSLLRIPVCLHNVPESDVFRPAVWDAFGMESFCADNLACREFGALYK